MYKLHGKKKGKQMKTSFLAVMVAGCTASGFVFAENLNYNFLNPSFIGGNVNNAASLLNQANAQNNFSAPTLSPVEKFQQNLQNAIFSKIQANILDPKKSAFGEYDTLGYHVSVTDAGSGLISITTTDKTTGAITTFTVDNSGP